MTSDSQPASSAIASRWLCHCGASASASSSARLWRTATALSPSWSSVPAAPPNCTTRQPLRQFGEPLAVPFQRSAPGGDAVADADRDRRLHAGHAHQHVFAEAVVHARRRSRPARSADRRTSPASAAGAASGRCRRHPGWSRRNAGCRGAVRRACARNCADQFGNDWSPSRATPSRSVGKSGAKASSAAPIASAASRAITPSAASASASARSKASMASSSASSEKYCAVSSSPR